MGPIKVLVVDDSVVVRRIVTGVLGEDPAVEVLATAANGRIALDKLETLRPDVVTLDIEMPEMNGIETLREIRQRFPRLPVIMFSTLTEHGASATLDALAAGANDFVTKPANVGSVTLGMQAVREQLIPKVKALAGRPSTAPASPLPRSVPGIGAPGDGCREQNRERSAARGPVGPLRVPAVPARLVVIGVSTGGPNALAAIWSQLPKLRVPVLICQHMPPVFTAMLAQRLDAAGTVPVSEGVDGAELEPGRAWLAPGNHHMVVERGDGGHRIRITQDAPENSCRPAVDPLFRTAADVYGSGVLALVLTGMGSDGALGAGAVRAAGGVVLAQDESTSVVWGMPGSVVGAGLADAILPLPRIADEIVRRTAAPRRGREEAGGEPDPERPRPSGGVCHAVASS
jgi:two-component system chemotaxis response regulator CheB